jgi:hypothetical protein
MAKEALSKIYPSLIFRETFRDEITVRKQGIPTDVDFSNGIGEFNGSSSKINLVQSLKLTSNSSIRFKAKINNSGYHGIVGRDTLTYSYLRFGTSSTTGNTTIFGETDINDDYISFSFSDIGVDDFHDFVITQDGAKVWKLYIDGTFIGQDTTTDSNLTFNIIGLERGSEYFDGSIDLVEIYKGTLTASEVANLYNNSWNTELSGLDGRGGTTVTSLAFFDSFISEANTISIGGTYNNVTYAGGTVLCVGSAAYVYYYLTMSGEMEYRVRFRTADVSQSNKRLIEFNATPSSRNLTFSGGELNCYDGTNNPTTSGLNLQNNTWYDIKLIMLDNNVRLYVNDIEVALSTNNWINQPHINQRLVVANFDSLAGYANVEIDYIEIYTIQTTLSQPKTLIDFDSTKGYADIGDLTESSTLTNITFPKIGSNRAALFNGSTSMIDTGTDMIGTKAVTVMGWIKPYTYGESNEGKLIDNGKSLFSVISSNDRIYFTSNNANITFSANNSISLNKKQFIVVTREADGTANLYIGDKTTTPTLSGGANQNSGTPEAGTTNVIIGNNSAASRTFDGLIPKLKVIEGILTLAEITQEWSSTLNKIK